MAEITLELSLNRSSGVLAGVVASLAQAGIELKSQKLQRAAEGRGGWLIITGSGESPEPAILAERLNGTRGVEKLVRVIVDGEAILAEGNLLEDQIQPDDLAELSAGSDAGFDENLEAHAPPAAPDQAGQEHATRPNIEEFPILSESEPQHDSPAEPGEERQAATPDSVADPAEQDLEAALGSAEENANPDGPVEFAAEPSAESDLAEALQDEVETAETKESSTAGEEDDNPAQVGAVLRRRRRRRR